MDYLKRFFGLPNKTEQSSPIYNNQKNQNDENSNRIPTVDEDLWTPSFHVFSNPLQMQQYFEHQMNEMLKFFGGGGFDDFFSNFSSSVPALEEQFKFSNEESPQSLRDHFLKNGYEKPSQNQSQKADKDIDESIHLGDLDSIFGRKNYSSPYERQPDGFFFGQSQSIKTIRKPDGTVETHRTVRDNKGNEETTICHKIGDKEYCVIKKKDKHGKEEIIENFINMDEKEKSILFGSNNLPTDKDLPPNDIFDKLFK